MRLKLQKQNCILKQMEILSQTKLKEIAKLLQKKNREEKNKFIIEGNHLVFEALNSNWNVVEIFLRENIKCDEIINIATRKNIVCKIISEKFLEKISETNTSQGIIAIVEKKSFFRKEILNSNLIVALDEISDPGNLGTIIRTCDWFDVNSILISKNSCELFNSKVIRSTQGSLFHTKIFDDINLKDEILQLKKNGFKIFSTSSYAQKKLYKMKFPQKSVFVFGNESNGISKNIESICDENFSIPKFGKGESLNVGISCGIILSHFKNVNL